jgi:hypothetical protein
MHRRFLIVLMLTALGCSAPALAGPPKSGDEAPAKPDQAPEKTEEPDQAPKDQAPKDQAPSDGEAQPDPPAHEEPPSPEPEPEPEPPAKPPTVTLSEPQFINGDVPKIASILRRTSKDVAQCVASHGGLGASAGKLRVQFLVRARGKAEGVEVLERKSVSKDAGRCVQKLLKNKWVGMPSQDPTGVQFSYELKAE